MKWLSLAIVSIALIATVSTDVGAQPPPRRVRALDGWAADSLDRGLTRAAVVRELVAALEQSDRIRIGHKVGRGAVFETPAAREAGARAWLELRGLPVPRYMKGRHESAHAPRWPVACVSQALGVPQATA